MARVDLNKLWELVSHGYLTSQKHPDADLWIFNYTAKTQYDRYWVDEMDLYFFLTIENDVLSLHQL